MASHVSHLSDTFFSTYDQVISVFLRSRFITDSVFQLLDNNYCMRCLSDTGAGSLDAVNAVETAVTEDTWGDSESELSEADGKKVRISYTEMHSLNNSNNFGP